MHMSDSLTVLLVTGDPIERMMVAEYLRGCGYRVIEAADGNEARLALDHEAIDVMVADVELPYHGSGHTLAARARAHQPELEVILTSSLERTAEVAADLCEQRPEGQPRYHPQSLVDRIQRLRERVRAGH
jgi:CheY-like chemotaxis protein